MAGPASEDPRVARAAGAGFVAGFAAGMGFALTFAIFVASVGWIWSVPVPDPTYTPPEAERRCPT